MQYNSKLLVYGVDMKEKSVTDRLAQVMKEKGFTKADLARAAKVTPQAAGRWFKNNSISKDSLVACANTMEVSIGWLLSGEEKTSSISEPATANKNDSNIEQFFPIDAWDSKTPLSEDDVEVPFYMEVELSAGHGSEVKLETSGFKLRFSKATLKRQGVEINAAACVKVTGNSMEPVIPDGATVGIDTAKTTIKDGDMYAIDWNGSLYVKTLTRKAGGGLRIRSFNIDEYPDEILDQEQAQHVRVIGRVFWYSVLR